MCSCATPLGTYFPEGNLVCMYVCMYAYTLRTYLGEEGKTRLNIPFSLSFLFFPFLPLLSFFFSS